LKEYDEGGQFAPRKCLVKRGDFRREFTKVGECTKGGEFAKIAFEKKRGVNERSGDGAFSRSDMRWLLSVWLVIST